MFKKVVLFFVVFFVLIVGAVVAIPFVFKDKINVLLKEQINNELKVSVDYSSYDLTILSSFPDFKFLLKDLIVVGQDKFAGDTLAVMKEMNFNLDAMKMYRERELKIHSVYINELNLKTYVLEDSTNSYDILKEKPEEQTTKIDTSSESLINMNFESLIVENSNILYKNDLTNQVILLKNLNINAGADYQDSKADIDGGLQLAELLFLSDFGNTKIDLQDLDLDLKGTYFEEKLNFDIKSLASKIEYVALQAQQNLTINNVTIDLLGDFLNNNLNVVTTTNLASTSFTQEDSKLLNKAKISLVGDIKADLDKKEYAFKQNQLKLNDLVLNYDGTVKMPTEAIALDLKFNTQQSTFKELLSIIPEKYLVDYKDTKVEGNFNLNGFVKGFYTENNLPDFNIDMGIEKGYFKNNSLPTAVEKINLKANVKNTNNKIDLDIPNAVFTIENEPINFSLKMLDVQNDAFVDLKAKGKMDLEKVPEFYKIEDLNKIDGDLDMDITFKGKLSDVEKKNFKNVDFQGDMKIADMIYDSKATEMPLKVKKLNLDFSPQYANLTNLDMTYGKSDIKATGKLENVINYVLSDGTITGVLNINSQKIDLTELMGDEEPSTTSTQAKSTESKATRVPDRINFTTNATINEILYDNIVLTKVNGNIVLKNEEVKINSVSANMLGGNAKINGAYSTKEPGKPVIDFKYDVKGFDINQTFKQVNTIQQIAPIAQYLDGKFSSSFSFNSLLEDDFMPDMSMLNGLGNVNISYASFLNFPVFQSISNAIKVPMLNLDKASIKNAWTAFKIRDGKVDVEPFDYAYQDIKMKVQGSNGFDKSIDYTMAVTVPSDKFGGAASVANNWLSKQKIPLLNLSVPKNITFHLNLSGFLQNPKVKILKVTSDGSDKGVVEQVTDGIKDKAKEEAEKLRKEAEDRARKEAQRLAKEAADKVAKEAADKIKNDAGKKVDDLLKGKLPNFGF